MLTDIANSLKEWKMIQQNSMTTLCYCISKLQIKQVVYEGEGPLWSAAENSQSLDNFRSKLHFFFVLLFTLIGNFAWLGKNKLNHKSNCVGRQTAIKLVICLFRAENKAFFRLCGLFILQPEVRTSISELLFYLVVH